MQAKDKKFQDWIDQLKRFLSKPKGIAIVAAAAFALCIVLGLGISNVVFGDEGDQDVDAPTVTATPEAADDSAYDAQADKLDVEKFTDTILPETEDAGQDYVDNTLFVGDSNTARYMNYGFVTLDNGIGVIGMSASQITTLPSVKFKGNKGLVTIDKAIPVIQPQRVVFAFGTNDLSGKPETYVEIYEKAIKKCYDAYPYFDIIISAIPPVDRYRDYNYISMQNVDKFNAALVGMCEKNGWKFLNTTEVLKDEETGFGKTDYTVYDGLHLSKEGVSAVFDHIRTHAYETEDRRPKPLKKKVERGETPPDLIMKDPVKHDGPHAKPSATPSATPDFVQVSFKAGQGGTIRGTQEQKVPYAGTCETVEAIPNEGYAFKKWSCTVGRLNPEEAKLTFTIPGKTGEFNAIMVEAHFVKVEPTPKPTPTEQPEAPVTPPAGNSEGANPSPDVDSNVPDTSPGVTPDGPSESTEEPNTPSEQVTPSEPEQPEPVEPQQPAEPTTPEIPEAPQDPANP